MTQTRPRPDRTRTAAWRGQWIVPVLAAAVVAAVVLVDPHPAATPLEARTGSGGFTEVAADVGIDHRHGAFRWGLSPDPVAMMGGGVCWLDADADGWMDLFLVDTYAEAEWGRWSEVGGVPTSALFRNTGGTFTDVTTATGTGLAVRGLGCVAGDVDGDGDTDLYVTTATTNALLVNDGAGSFRDVAPEAGVAVYGWHTGAALGDIDGDGRMDLYVAGYVDPNRPVEGSTQGFPRTHHAVADRLFAGRGVDADGTPRFEEVSFGAGDAAYGLGVMLTDIDADGDLDIHVANDTQPNRLYVNESHPGTIRLVERAADRGVADEHSGMGVGAGDVDGDGTTDLVVTNLDHQFHGLYGNLGSGFASLSETSGLARLEGAFTGWAAMLADFDLDTDLDLMVVNGAVPLTGADEDRQPLQLFTSELGESGRLSFTDGSAWLAGIGSIVGRGGAAADFDNDGDLDVAISRVGGTPLLLRNDSSGGAALVVAPDPPLPGTVVTVELADGTTIRRAAHAGSGYLGSEDPRLHFGLGDDGGPVTVAVTWPDGRTRRLSGIPAGSLVTVHHDDTR